MNGVAHFFYLRSISHRQRQILCNKAYEHFRFFKTPPKPSKSEVKAFVLGFLVATVSALLIGRWLL